MTSSKPSRAGVTLTELCVITAMILVLTGLSLPSLSRILANAKLKGAASQLAAFYEQSRIRATQDDTYYEVLLNASGGGPSQVCLDLNGNGVCDANEPQVEISLAVTFADKSSVPSPMDAATLGFSPLTTASSIMYNQQNGFVPGLAWNGRGLPCQRPSPTSPCSPIPGPGGWVQYLVLSSSTTDATYAAVAVGPTGRIKVWTYSNTGGNKNWF